MIGRVLTSQRVLDTVERTTEVTSWHTHVPFAFWCVEALRPRIFVELGTHRGDSYCAFCQAVERCGLATACYAVDTWRGDPHAGQYGEDVYEELRAYHEPRYAQFSRLVRSTFDEAVEHFSDRSIDLLHIDGLHTYEAVRHDFETWEPRLSPAGVVLFHDINVRENGFGVWRFWAEISTRYPSFTFHHGHGLGVLVVGPEAPEPARALAACNGTEAAAVRELFARLGGIVGTQALVRRYAPGAETLDGLVARHRQEAQRLEQRTHDLETQNRDLDDRIHDVERRLAAESQRAEAAERDGQFVRQLLKHAHDPRRGPARLVDSLRRRSIARGLIASGLFDAQYYRRTYVDLPPNMDSVRHYVKRGVWEGRNPHAMFDSFYYLRENPEVARRGINPLLHFALRGAREGRRPHPLFTAQDYLKAAAQGRSGET